MGRYVYYFEPGDADGSAAMQRYLGANGAHLAEMARLGLPVPPGLTIATDACVYFLRHGRHVPGLEGEVREAIARIEAFTETGWGHAQLPLLLSARSGAHQEMPAAMTARVLNLGINDKTMTALADSSGDERFAYVCRRRMIRNYARIVYDLSVPSWELPLHREALSLHQWQAMIEEMQQEVQQQAPTGIPDDPDRQLWATIEALFKRWDSPPAQAYRRRRDIDDGSGTGVTLMAMVFGERDRESGSGVGFSRHPITGRPEPYGEYLQCAQGEDVIAGQQTPNPIQRAHEDDHGGASLQVTMPEVHAELANVLQRLEHHYRQMQEVEFCIESGRLWLLQTRGASRTGAAALRVALDMVDESLIDEEEAVLRVDPTRHIPQLLAPRIATGTPRPAGTLRGTPVSPGAAVGRVVTKVAEALARSRRGEPIVLVQSSANPEAIDALPFVDAVIFLKGGVTTQVVAITRELALPCICGVAGLDIADDGSGLLMGDQFVARGEFVTVDGTSGDISVGQLPLVEGREGDSELERFLDQADRFRRMDVRIACDSFEEVEQGIAFGADGIGMWRTEQMILADRGRVMAMRKALLSGDEESSEEAMHELLRLHRHDIAQMLRAANGRPVTFRLLDAPLSLFLPHQEPHIVDTAEALQMEVDEIVRRVEALDESNPMLGLRGGRLAIVQPSICAMQVRALVEAARIVVDDGIAPVIEILIPRVADGLESRWVSDKVEATIAEHLHGATEQISFEVGAMIQLPRAALVCDEIAANLDFIVVATQQLTRFVWGMAPDDVGRFMTHYVEEGLISRNPFESLDRRGVGELIRIAIARGRSHGGELVVGVGDGHAHDPRSIRFFESLDVDHLTVDAGDVPATKVAAAQAYIAYERALRKRAHPGPTEL